MNASALLVFALFATPSLHATPSSRFKAPEWGERRDRLEAALTEAFRHARGPELVRRVHVKRVLEELRTINTALHHLDESAREQAAALSIRDAVRRALDEEQPADEVQARAMADVYLTITDEARFEAGRMMSEVTGADDDSSNQLFRRRALTTALAVALLEGTMFYESWYLVMIPTFPLVVAFSLGFVVSTPTTASLQRDLIRPTLTDCESLVLRSVVRAGGLSSHVIEQADRR
jgi:hypothetical protein